MRQRILIAFTLALLAVGAFVGWSKYLALSRELALQTEANGSPAVTNCVPPQTETEGRCPETDAGAPLVEEEVFEARTAEEKGDEDASRQKPERSEPYVRYAASGRYLPPSDRPLVEVETFDVTNVHAEICRVEPSNLVQLLAREEGKYARFYSWGDEDHGVAELSGKPESSDWPVRSVADGKGRAFVPVEMADGGPARGIFFVRVCRGGLEPNDCRSNGAYNPYRCRIVCITDIGLSVRKGADGALLVWVTSLTTGRPVPFARLIVYSSANILVGQGETDMNGCCHVPPSDKGEPFVVAAYLPSGEDLGFVVLQDSTLVDETHPDGARDVYLKPGECEAFVWTERGIYRHGEPIFVQAILRNDVGNAPDPQTFSLQLYRPDGSRYALVDVTSDANGVLSCETFSVPDDQPSGTWRFVIRPTGKEDVTLGEHKIRLEEFAPPQIRVKAEPVSVGLHPTNFTFVVSAEHLYGGPAKGLRCEAAVLFEDVPFSLDGWKGDNWAFGDESRGLKPSFRRIRLPSLDGAGESPCVATLPLASGMPVAAVRVMAQGTVFEDGGRPANVRYAEVLHYYPYYIGATVPGWLRKPEGGRPRILFACVTPDGKRVSERLGLMAKIERLTTVCEYRRTSWGNYEWKTSTRRSVLVDGLALANALDEDSVFELPIDACGDYALTIADPATGVSFSRTFYLSDWGDDAVRVPLSMPSRVSVLPDREQYVVGDTPRLVVKAPFAGHALVTVCRESLVHHEVVALTNATSEIELPTLGPSELPNLDVSISVVQGVDASARHLAARAHGQATLRMVRPENALPVVLTCRAEDGRPGTAASGKCVVAELFARGASSVTVTAVDEGINLLTDEALPDPCGYFSRSRDAEHPLFDIYRRILPVIGEDGLRTTGVKIGGGALADMFGRVSPTPTRRFRPLARWQTVVPDSDGRAQVVFPVGEFAGEVRLTAVACSPRGTGSAKAHVKVVPRLVMQPDAPRFAAPGDSFDVTLPVANRGGTNGTVACVIDWGTFDGRANSSNAGRVSRFETEVVLEDGASTNLVVRVDAPSRPGEMAIRYAVRGFGEHHQDEILLPVRPAVAWRERAGVERLAPGEIQPQVDALKARLAARRFSFQVLPSRTAELKRALDWLSEYRHGCLEQTTSRVFPLVGDSARLGAVRRGVRRVESMVRSYDFTMWPDTITPPWDPEVSLYAAHFLMSAERHGVVLGEKSRARVLKMLHRRVYSTNACHAAYASLSLALAGEAEKDRMARLYERRNRLTLLARARLALAFAETGDRHRAGELLGTIAAPSSVRDAAFGVLALLKLDADDARLPMLVRFLEEKRDRQRFCWGTTGENAHALLALAAYFRAHPMAEDARSVAWQALDLPRPEDLVDVTNTLSVVRRFLSPDDGKEIADLSTLRRGDLVTVEIELAVDQDRNLYDLVVEDLFAAAFEPVRQPTSIPDWVLRWEPRDDRAVIFSKPFSLSKGARAIFQYPLRVVSTGDYVLPGASVEAMYEPSLHSVRKPLRIQIGR